jgi:hypothetical protein
MTSCQVPEIPDAENVHAGWRLRVAERAAGAYRGNRNLAALAVAGSVGETVALADAHSDADVGAFRDALSGRRPAIGPP